MGIFSKALSRFRPDGNESKGNRPHGSSFAAIAKKIGKAALFVAALGLGAQFYQWMPNQEEPEVVRAHLDDLRRKVKNRCKNVRCTCETEKPAKGDTKSITKCRANDGSMKLVARYSKHSTQRYAVHTLDFESDGSDGLPIDAHGENNRYFEEDKRQPWKSRFERFNLRWPKDGKNYWWGVDSYAVTTEYGVAESGQHYHDVERGLVDAFSPDKK